MNKRNYQNELDKLIETLVRDGRVPKLLLHSCCAPCSSYCLEYLSQYFEVTVLYYNPNISPAEEYEYRVAEQKRFIREFPATHPISFIEGRYEPSEFYDAVKGLEHEPEGGKRCPVCFGLRLAEAATIAKANGFDYFTTTLSISPLKNAELLNQIGEQLAIKYDIPYLFSDFKKKNGYKRSTELSKEYGLYRQNFCGCEFSKRDTQNNM